MRIPGAGNRVIRKDMVDLSCTFLEALNRIMRYIYHNGVAKI